MTLEQVKKLYEAQPFQPFTLRLADGGRLDIKSREYFLVPPRGRMIAVWDPVGAIRLIDLLLVTEAVVPDKNGASRRPPKPKQ